MINPEPTKPRAKPGPKLGSKRTDDPAMFQFPVKLTKREHDWLRANGGQTTIRQVIQEKMQNAQIKEI